MKLHFYGGAGEVTGANYLLEANGKKIIIDCGLFQGDSEKDKKNQSEFLFNPKEVDLVIITHAHLDHTGRLPNLISQGFEGKILATPPTKDFATLMLEDSWKILNQEARKEGIIPPPGHKYIEEVVNKFETLDYHQKYGLLSGISVSFKDAGHVLGSAIVEIEAEGKKIVFSGDLGAGRLALLSSPEIPKDADYVVIESAYGDRIHEEVSSSKDLLEDAVEETINQKGVLMIPSFALERTQEILYHFNELVENNRIPRVPIYLDSPLAIGLTEIYKKYEDYYSKKAGKLASVDNIFDFPGLTLTESVTESKKINEVSPPKIIIAGAGMSQGGRILHHELRYLSDPKNTILIVTYQAKGTPGRKILQEVEYVEILNSHIPLNAKVKQIAGYSSHADQAELMHWIKQVEDNSPEGKPEKVFVCQGEQEASQALSQLMRDKLAIDARVPTEGESVEL